MSRFGLAIYRLLLQAFPAGFRQRHADAMSAQFLQQRQALRGRPAAIVVLWLRAMLDALRHGIGHRIEHRRAVRTDHSRAAQPGGAVRSLLYDFRTAVRGLRRQPAFTATTIATLALGIGANAAVFALAWHTTFRPLPYPAPEQLIRIFESNPAGGQPMTEVSPASLRSWAEQVPSLEAVGTFGGVRVIFPLDDDGAVARYQALSPAVLKALGVHPILGRVVLADADRRPKEVLIGYDYWQRRFGGDPNVVDRLHRFNDVAGKPERIIGVMPKGFQFLEPADVWSIGQSYSRGSIGRGYRSLRQDSVLARVRPGHTVAEATAEVTRVSAELSLEFPDTHGGWTPIVQTLHESVVGRFSIMSFLLIAATCAVFAVGCINIAGLLVMRAANLRHEVSLRMALGASRWRISRMWCFEGLAVGSAGFAVGLLVAGWLIEGLTALAPASLPRLNEVTLSMPIVGVCAAAVLLFIAVYTAAPLTAGVLRGGREALGGMSGVRTVSSGHRGRHVLLAVQAGLAAVLLSGAVLFATSLQHLSDEPLGFVPSGVLSVRVSPDYGGNRRPWAMSAELGRALEARLRQHPGVIDAAVSTSEPLESGLGFSVHRVDGDVSEQHWGAIEHAATPGFLRTLGLALTDGRWFTDTDRLTDEQLIASGDSIPYATVITESMARTLWPNESAVGKQLISVMGDNPKIIVGVVADLKLESPDRPPVYRLFVPWYQRPGAGSMAVLVKTAGDPAALIGDVGAIVRSVAPNTGIRAGRTLEELLRASSAGTRFATSLVGGFSLLALLLTGVGVFGTVGYAVTERRRELAVRLALGAARTHVSGIAAASGFVPILVGTVVGLAAAVGSVRFVRGLLFEVDPLAPGHYLVAAATLIVVTAIASAVPLHRVLSIDPAESLREG